MPIGHPQTQLQTEKKCPKCGVVQTDENSTRRSRNPNCFAGTCRACFLKYSRERNKAQYVADPEKAKAKWKAFYARNSGYYTARRYGITKEDLDKMRNAQ